MVLVEQVVLVGQVLVAPVLEVVVQLALEAVVVVGVVVGAVVVVVVVVEVVEAQAALLALQVLQVQQVLQAQLHPALMQITSQCLFL